MSRKRTASIRRETRETRVALELDLDGSGQGEFRIGIPFLEHMLDQVARHGMLDLKIIAEGDLDVDAHHTVEDVGICLGQGVRDALGDKTGIRRFGHAYIPLDEALSRVVVDCSGRPGLEYHVEYPRARIGEFDVDLVREFFQALANHAGLTVHADNLRGRNAHHIAETLFKGFGRALRMALEPDSRLAGATPSTKGSL
ncbi:MAG: imidazoleglycerol-phosphate dehydratase HisB [Gammaproteobacteria bacterium]|nr:imidazoleglycerol-phosphate dehydratase HisB [Gammaproteobacteria bacterium]